MHERKARLAELADVFVALPGGAGTLEELFQVWTWGQLGLHTKPAALLDPDGFYVPLLAQLDVMTQAGYLAPVYRQSLGVVADVAELLAWLEGYQHPPTKWPRLSTAYEPLGELTSVGWVHVRDGRLLAVRTRGRDRFYLPGGKLDPGESPEQGLVREVREELRVTVHDPRPLFTVHADAHGLPAPARLTMHCFAAAAHQEPQPAGEIEEVAWLTVPDDPRAAPAVRDVLDRLASHQHTNTRL